MLVRPTSDLRNIADLNADRVEGDLRDPASIEKSLSGCEVVFHVAADYRLWVRDPDEMYRSNVEGTRALLEAARKKKACGGWCTPRAWQPWGSFGFEWDQRVPTNEAPVSLADMIGHYKRSKFMAEQVAIEAAKSGVDVVIVNPTTPIGERDIKPTPTGRIVVGFSEAEVSGVCRDGTEPGRCNGMRARACPGF